MGEIEHAKKVRFVVGILTQFPSAVDQVFTRLEKEFGKSDLSSPLLPFFHTPHYDEEMGENLYRRCFTFPKLVDPDELPAIKAWTNKLERKLASSGKFEVERPVNIDPGYVTLTKLVLASSRDYAHRVHIGDGVYGEIALAWSQATFAAREGTRPDFKSREMIGFFNRVRALYASKVALEEV